MSAKMLVDTSAWIVSFRKSGNEQMKKTLLEALDTLSVATTNIFILELLQGCRNRNEYDAMHARLKALEAIPINAAVWDLSYTTGYELKRKGITVPTLDLVIASAAKIHDCSLLHHDKHFRTLSKHLHINAVDYIDD